MVAADYIISCHSNWLRKNAIAITFVQTRQGSCRVFLYTPSQQVGEEVIWMGSSERRQTILEHLCQKRFDTTKKFAELFGVCERTIRYDLVILTCSYPIETSFGPYGEVRVANWFRPDRHMLSAKQAELLRQIRPMLNAGDAQILDTILTEFAPKAEK